MDKQPSALILTLLLFSGPSFAEQSEPQLGTAGNPVKTLGLDGARSYIESLDCENGAIPEYKHDTTTEVGPSGNKLDKYLLRCDGDKVEMYTIYLDPNHNVTENKPVKGFVSWL